MFSKNDRSMLFQISIAAWPATPKLNGLKQCIIICHDSGNSARCVLLGLSPKWLQASGRKPPWAGSTRPDSSLKQLWLSWLCGGSSNAVQCLHGSFPCGLTFLLNGFWILRGNVPRASIPQEQAEGTRLLMTQLVSNVVSLSCILLVTTGKLKAEGDCTSV